MSLEEALNRFVIESHRLLEGMEYTLLRVESPPDTAAAPCAST